ncbi:MAG: dienelactone hydrolase family protein [Woeseiaceae bacterium]|jgi:carboxymethylenebutenolidase|nr:dienelactone hydrolase family protein [Woeseiaceae bacterium]
MADSNDFDPKILKLFDGYVHGMISRRQFLERVAGLTAAGVSAAGVLAALSPDYALARQVDPDDESITVSYKKYASAKGAGVMQGYYARPAIIDHKLPGVVVVHENRGLNPYIEDVARRLAVAGFIAFAPDALFPLGGYPGNDDDGRQMQRERDPREMFEDFSAAIDFLQEHPDCSGKAGIVGFCYGGGVVMQMAVERPDLGAGVAFYGRHPAGSEAASIEAPLLIHHGELDERVNASWPDFKAGLDEAGKDYEQFVYAGANHGFHNDTTPRYDSEAAELAWQRTLGFFTRHLES